MSEYWKSTPKYWCKHCGIYVRDTKLERTNHEATGKHQGALKRFLRDLHRGHEQELREKDRARREIERLNGVVASSSSSSSFPSSSSSKPTTETSAAQARNPGGAAREQWEQLAGLGVEVPGELRREMAMAGEWTVTNTRVVAADDGGGGGGGKSADGLATGVRKRSRREAEGGDAEKEKEREEEVEEEEAAIRGLFKKPRRWGRDARHAPEDDAELDALLSGTLVPKKEEEEEEEEKEKIEIKMNPETVKQEEEEEEGGLPKIKKEEPAEGQTLEDIARPDTGTGEGEKNSAAAKKEEQDGRGVDPEAVPIVAFKKRKPKNIRQK